MLALILKVGEKLCAIPARSVVEVVPKVELLETPEAPPWLAGLCAYRGMILPVVDLSMRMDGKPGANLLSSRIIVVRRAQSEAVSCYGLLSENVADVKKIDESSGTHVHADLAPYFEGVVLDDGKAIHLLDLAALLPPSRRHGLSAGESIL